MWHHSELEGEIYVLGSEAPPWLNTDEIRFIRVPLAEHKREHTGRSLEALLRSEVSEEFLWMNDDFFILEDRDDWPIWAHDMTLREQAADLPEKKHMGRFGYAPNLVRMAELLESWGFPDTLSLETHTPLKLRKSEIGPLYDRARAEAPDLPRGFFRSLYAAAGHDLEPIPDVKLYEYSDQLPEAPLVSTNPVAWNVGLSGKAIRRKYWRPAPWEQK